MTHPRKSPYTSIPRKYHPPIEPISEGVDYDAILKAIPIQQIVSHGRVVDHIYNQQRYRDDRLKAEVYGKQSLAFGYLVGMVYPLIVERVRKSASSPFNGLTPYHIHVIMSVWLVCLLNEDSLCRLSQILPHSEKLNKRFIEQSVQYLESVGILRAVEDAELHRLSGKIRYFNHAKYLVLTSLGNRLVDEFNDIFGKMWSKMVGDTWLSTLEKLP